MSDIARVIPMPMPTCRSGLYHRPIVELLDEKYRWDWDLLADYTCLACYVRHLSCACNDFPYRDAMCWRAGDPIYRGGSLP